MKLFLTDLLINSAEELLVIVYKLEDEHRREEPAGSLGMEGRDLCSYGHRKAEEGKDHKHLFFFWPGRPLS